MVQLTLFVDYIKDLYYNYDIKFYRTKSKISGFYYDFINFFANIWKYRRELIAARDWEGCVNFPIFTKRVILRHIATVEATNGFHKHTSPPKRVLLEMVELCDRVALDSNHYLRNYDIEEWGIFTKKHSEMPNFNINNLVAIRRNEEERLFQLLKKYSANIWD